MFRHLACYWHNNDNWVSHDKRFCQIWWLISTNGGGLGLGLLSRWLHCTMQNFFHWFGFGFRSLYGEFPEWLLYPFLGQISIPGTDLRPYSIHLNQRIRVWIQASGKTCKVQESVLESESESESGGGNKPLQIYIYKSISLSFCILYISNIYSCLQLLAKVIHLK